MQPCTESLHPEGGEIKRIASELATLKNDEATLKNDEVIHEKENLLEWLNEHGRNRTSYTEHLLQSRYSQLAER